MIKLWADILFKFQWEIEIFLVNARLGPGLSSISALNKRLYNHGSDHIVMIATRKDNVWECLVLLYELDFNVKNTVMSNTNKRLMLQNGKAQFKKEVFWHGRPKERVDLW